MDSDIRTTGAASEGEEEQSTTPEVANQFPDYISLPDSDAPDEGSVESVSEGEWARFEERLESNMMDESDIELGIELRSELRRFFDPTPSTPKRTHREGATKGTRGETDCSTDDESQNSPRSTTSEGSSPEWVLEPIKTRAPELVEELEAPIRYCVFNVGQISRPDFWKILRERLSKEILKGVQRIQSITQPNRRRRIDMWVAASVASKLKSAMGLTAAQRRNGTNFDHKMPMRMLRSVWRPNEQTKSWRIDVFRTWRDRGQVYKAPRPERLEPPRKTIMTFNVNGLREKRAELQGMLEKKDVGIIALQETLCGKNTTPLRLPGYEVYQRPKTRSFRGQALAIHNSYTSYEVGQTAEDYLIYVRVVGLTAETTWHVMSIYLPSGGNNRSKRTECVNGLLKKYQQIMEKDPKSKVLIMGDFNMSRKLLAKKLRVQKSGLVITKVSGNGMTFHRKSTRWSDLDSIVVSPEAGNCIRTAKVLRQWSELEEGSDHFPLATRLRNKTDVIQEAPPVRMRFDTDKIKGHGKSIVFSNRWSCLSTDPITTSEELDQAAQEFANTVNTEGLELGIKTPVSGQVYVYDRVLKRKVKKVANARRCWLKARFEKSKDADQLEERYKTLKKTVRQKVAEKQQKLHEKRVKQVTELYRDHEMKSFHRWESQNTINGVSSSINKVTPVQDKEGRLLTNKKDVLERTNEYYKELSQDDPENLSRNENYWKGKATVRREEPLDCNQPIVWHDVLLATRSMALGTAPGNDDIPIEVYKSLLKEECHEHLRNHQVIVGDGTYVALPEDKLPEEPCTPMGKQLNRIIQGIWTSGTQPKCWSQVTNISIHKTGDPTNLQNYRGISLIAVGMKIFTVILALRISKLAELNNLFTTEQGGFRTGEEAIAQFVALAEIVRRRRFVNKKTWIVFIDFKKAFDKVMHEALFEKMEAIGFRGKFLEIIKSIYKTSSACTRVGGEYGTVYEMLRGTRQGCPLSPILFLLFINDFLTYVPKGVEVPGMWKGPKHCPGLLFADDVAGLLETEEDVHAFLAGVTKWSKTWHMPMGASKCGVMLVGGTEEEQEQLSHVHFEVDGQKIAAVRKYKYLGIYITDKLGDKEATDETAHCKVLQKKIKEATDMRRAFLNNGDYPLALKVTVINSKIASVGCYGGEWVGMCQKRTDIVQSELNKALRIALSSATRSQLHNETVMSIELGVPTIEQRMSDMRVRLLQKAPSMRTWLSLLVDPENRIIDRTKTWVTGSQHNLKRLQPYWLERDQRPAESIVERRATDARAKEILAKRERYEYIDDPLTARNKEHPKRQRQEAGVTVLSRSLMKGMYSKKQTAVINYMSFGFDRTRDYLNTAIYTPKLTEGTVWLARLRTGAWWTTEKRYHALRMTQLVNHLQLNVCPCCNHGMRVGEPEFVHIILDCSAWGNARKKYLGNTIKYFLERPRWSTVGCLDAKHSRLEIVSRILGGWIYKKDHIPMYRSRTPTNSDDRQETPTSLDAYATSWGATGDVHLPGLNAHGFVLIAKFLETVMPQHKLALFPKGKTETEKEAYATTSGEESPVKKRNLLRPVTTESKGENVPDADSEGSDELTYPQGNLSAALHTNAEAGMGTRWTDAKERFVPHALGYDNSDEGSGDEEGNCIDRCYPRLQAAWSDRLF